MSRYIEEKCCNVQRPKNCIFRHENGNCLMIGGFCTSVNETICQALRNAYSRGKADVEEVKHGKWIMEGGVQICSACHNRARIDFNYHYIASEHCSHCGAKMDLE